MRVIRAGVSSVHSGQRLTEAIMASLQFAGTPQFIDKSTGRELGDLNSNSDSHTNDICDLT